MSDSVLNIALCLSGEPRYYERCIPGIQQLKNDPNVNLDVFYHLWSDITKRQKEIREEPVIEKVNTEFIQNTIQPTYGIFEDKQTLDPKINDIYEYSQKLINDYGIIYKERKEGKEIRLLDIVIDKNLLEKHIKYTNHPWYSQLYSMCKAQMMRIEYEKQNNIHYDFVLRSRTDVELFYKNLNKLFDIKNHPNNGRSGPRTNVYFPSLYIKGNNFLQEQIRKTRSINLPIHVEYCYFVGNSDTLSEEVFKNYEKDLLEYMVQIKGDVFYSSALSSVTECNNTTIETIRKATLFQPTSHTFVPYLLLKYTDCELRSGIPSINQKLKQMENLERRK
tara:strand:- start:162 stop:1163 length:1002 start_codon:yes stop_codon:yes gene_type:complete